MLMPVTPISIVIAPTEAALAGQYGIPGAGYGIETRTQMQPTLPVPVMQATG